MQPYDQSPSDQRFLNSVVSFPKRGLGGDPKYRGNWGGSFVESMIATHYPGHGIVVDPMQGGCTTSDVCRRLGIPYLGSDLRSGFDATTDDLLERVLARTSEPVTLITWHPPYAGAVTYSNDLQDLSAHGTDIDAFGVMVHACMRNFTKAIAPNGRICVLIGNWRKSGRFYRLSTIVERAADLAGLTLVDETIKIQHNCSSQRKPYARLAFPRIIHETLLAFENRERVRRAASRRSR